MSPQQVLAGLRLERRKVKSIPFVMLQDELDDAIAQVADSIKENDTLGIQGLHGVE